MRLITLMCITAVLFSCKPNSPAVISVVPKDTTVIFPTPTDSITDIIPIIHHPKPKDTVIIPPVVIIVPNTDTIIIPLHPPALPVLPIDTIIIPHPIIIIPTPFVPIVPIIPIPVIPIVPIIELKPFQVISDIDNVTIQDLKDVLQEYKDGRQINIIKVPLESRTGQAFYISANTTNVELHYTTKQSLENAVYTYLDMLGIHWYGAGVNWLVKKPILNTINIEGKWIEPTFRNRTFDGTGGLDYGLSTDPNFLYKKNWYAFKRRNRFNGDFQQPQHSGEEFYLENKALCDSNTQWFNSTSGRIYGRIKVEIPEAVQAYKNWYKLRPNVTDTFVTINTDPEDGRGGSDDPLPPDGFNGINNWNASDKWWYFANEIAKEYDSNSTKLHIAALAYGDGATNTLIPKFPLKKNVFPVIIPYAFQKAYLPKQMVRVWHANTAGNMGIYDYWNITQWSLGLPQFDIYRIPDLLSFWRKNAINCIEQETTDAGGPMGHVFWLAGQLEFDTTKNIDTIFKKYLVDCFGNGWKPMKNMFDRWSLNYQYNQDVNFSLKDLKDASDSVMIESPEWKRINDLKAYVHFMKLMAQRNGTQPNNDSIYQYIYTIHQRMLVQTAAMAGQHYLGPDPQPISDHQLTEAEIETNFASDIAALPVEYPISNFVFDYDKTTYIDSMSNDSWKYGIFSGGYFKANYTGTFSIDMGGQAITKVKIFTEDSVYVNENVGPTDFTFIDSVSNNRYYMKNYVINVVAGQTYTISTYYGFGHIRVRTPNIIIFNRPAANDFDNAGYPNRYFYVPKGTTKIAYLDGEPQPMNGRGYLVTPDGVALLRTATTAKDVYTVNVPEGMDGKIWIANIGHSGWLFINIPNITTLQPFSYTE